MPYPAVKVTFVDPAGTNFVAGTPAGASAVDHATQHTSHNDVVEAIEDTVGTTAGTNTLMYFAAGQFPVRHTGVAATGTLVQTLVGGTFANTTLIGTPQITGGTVTSSILNSNTIGTPQITGGTIANSALIGTSQITGGTIVSMVVNNSTIGTPAITGGTSTNQVITTGTIGNSIIGTPSISNGTMTNTFIGGTLFLGTASPSAIIHLAPGGLNQFIGFWDPNTSSATQTLTSLGNGNFILGGASGTTFFIYWRTSGTNYAAILGGGTV